MAGAFSMAEAAPPPRLSGEGKGRGRGLEGAADRAMPGEV